MEWLGRAYAVAVAASVALKAATLLRLRRKGTESKPFKAAVNPQVGRREIPLGVIGCGLIVGVSALAMIATRRRPFYCDRRASRWVDGPVNVRRA